MTDFTYSGLAFTPVRNLTDQEHDHLSQYIRLCKFSPKGFTHADFYAAAKSADPENEVDLFLCNGELVLPSNSCLHLFRDPSLPEHYIREQERSLNATASLSMLLAVMDETGKDGFYPTPESLADEMAAAADLDMVSTVLEPSAGKGDLVEALARRSEARYYRNQNLDVDCIEINPDLRCILKGKGYRVVHDDFLTFSTFKHYDLILMNPPFRDADQHLMKALDMQKGGGQVVCLLNAETLRNPCTNLRRELRKRLDACDAHVTYYKDRFADAQRPTDVEIALVSVTVPAEKQDSDIYQRMEKADEAAHEDVRVEDLAPDDFIERITRQYQIESSAGAELIRQYEAMKPYMLEEIVAPGREKEVCYNNPILELKVLDRHIAEYGSIVNRYLKLTRYKYWNALLNDKEFMGKLTSEMQKKWRSRVEDLSNYDFTPFNIHEVVIEMNAQIYEGVEQSIMQIFEQLTAQHTWYPECQNNVHYYNGWAHNKAHKINTKVIIPSYGLFPDWKWDHDTFKVYEAYNHLADIERCFNYLDGNTTAEVDLFGTLQIANSGGVTRNIHCKFFDVTFYKKGTTHIKFTNQRLLDKFNIYCSRKKNWLPPCYGKRRYEDMGREEQSVIDEFQGREAYEEVLKDSAYFLPETSSLLSLPSAV